MHLSTKIMFLRIAYWLGIILDAFAFVQMAFPEVGKKILGVTRELGPEYVFAINLGAGLMLAWTLLLVWADRKPMERRMIIPLTMIIIAWNFFTMIYAVNSGLIPAATMMPQIIICGLLFGYYGFCFAITMRVASAEAGPERNERVTNYHSVVLFVRDIEAAKRFYIECLSMPVDMDMGKNVILGSGITLWEIRDDNIIVQKVTREKIGTVHRGELYFETGDLDAMRASLSGHGIEFLHDIHEEPWGQRTMRLYDYDGNIVEVGEDLKTFLGRMAKSGMGREELMKKTGMTIDDIENCIGYTI